ERVGIDAALLDERERRGLRDIGQVLEERLELVRCCLLGLFRRTLAGSTRGATAGQPSEKTTDNHHAAVGQERHHVGGLSQCGNARFWSELREVVLACWQGAHALLEREHGLVAAKGVLAV